jgi:hypothetical protein
MSSSDCAVIETVDKHYFFISNEKLETKPPKPVELQNQHCFAIHKKCYFHATQQNGILSGQCIGTVMVNSKHLEAFSTYHDIIQYFNRSQADFGVFSPTLR